jgi:hypothetical protein
MPTHRGFAACLLALTLLPTAVARSEESGDARRDMDLMEATLDRVVRQVSNASASPFLGATEASRAYHLPGYGTLFVIPPRVLPRTGKVMIVRKEGPDGSLIEWSSDVAPNEANEASEAMARATSKLRIERRRIEKELEAQTHSRSSQSREKELRAIEEQVEALQREAQRTRQDAERAFERAVREVEMRLGPSDGLAPVAPPPPPSSPPAPVAQLAPPAPLPPPPPWRYWFDSEDTEDERSPERVVADVKNAIALTLEAQGSRLRFLRPDEFIAVAVAFVPQWGFDDGTRPETTLILRVRKKDLDERGAGKIGPEELRKRFEIVEY